MFKPAALPVKIEAEIEGDGFKTEVLFEAQKPGELNKPGQVLIGEILACKAAAVMGALKSLPGGSLQNQKLHLCRIGKKKKCMRQDGKERVYHVETPRCGGPVGGLSKLG